MLKKIGVFVVENNCYYVRESFKLFLELIGLVGHGNSLKPLYDQVRDVKQLLSEAVHPHALTWKFLAVRSSVVVPIKTITPADLIGTLQPFTAFPIARF
jgi:hypothetical protein